MKATVALRNLECLIRQRAWSDAECDAAEEYLSVLWASVLLGKDDA